MSPRLLRLHAGIAPVPAATLTSLLTVKWQDAIVVGVRQDGRRECGNTPRRPDHNALSRRVVMADRESTALPRPTFAALLESAVTSPGVISRAYSAFHSFSLGNQLLAAMQCAERRLPLGPLASYQAWKQHGRHVRRGERALWLWMPLTMRRSVTREDGSEETETYTRFALKPHWFVYAQTEGREMPVPAIPEWNRTRALATLDVTEIPFDLPDGNVQGFARGRSIAISPVAAMPAKTTFHELAHVLLGHTGET